LRDASTLPATAKNSAAANETKAIGFRLLFFIWFAPFSLPDYLASMNVQKQPACHHQAFEKWQTWRRPAPLRLRKKVG
jgi:hypothetical protein